MKKVSCLISIKFLSLKNRIRSGSPQGVIKSIILFFLSLAFWVGTFLVFYRVLSYFRGVEMFGEILVAKLLSLIFLTFFSILIFSNLITSLSTFFLSEDLSLLFSLPLPQEKIYLAKSLETILTSSWMVLLFGFPVFIAYGVVYQASWSYYGGVIGILIPFLIVAGELGIIIGMGLVNIFPARRTRDLFFLLSIFFFVSLFLLFRFMRPERLVDPDSFATVVEFFKGLKTPSSPFLPNHWATTSLLSLLQVKKGEWLFFFLLLWSTALALVVMGNWVASLLYRSGFNKTQETKRIIASKSLLFNRVIEFFTRPLSSSTQAIMLKDIKTFFRDTNQWSQLFLLLALLIVYLYNFSVLPLDRSPWPTFSLKNLVSFLNMALAGFVLAAIGARFVFPAISLEGYAFWIVKTSPLSSRQFFLSKFWMSFIPLLILAEILIFLSNYLLKVTPFMMVLSSLTVGFMTLGITSLGVGMGATYPNFHTPNAAQISTGFGGLIYMIISMSFIGLVVILEAWPVYLILISQIKNLLLTRVQWITIGLSFLTVIFLNLLALLLPLKIGLKKLEEIEG